MPLDPNVDYLQPIEYAYNFLCSYAVKLVNLEQAGGVIPEIKENVYPNRESTLNFTSTCSSTVGSEVQHS
jgi:hypothetical protein